MKKYLQIAIAALLLVLTSQTAQAVDCSSTTRDEVQKIQNESILSSAATLSDNQTNAALGDHKKGALKAVHNIFEDCSGGVLRQIQSGWQNVKSLSSFLSLDFIESVIKTAMENALQEGCDIVRENTQNMLQKTLGNTTTSALNIIDSARSRALSLSNGPTTKLDQISTILNNGNDTYVRDMFKGAILP